MVERASRSTVDSLTNGTRSVIKTSYQRGASGTPSVEHPQVRYGSQKRGKKRGVMQTQALVTSSEGEGGPYKCIAVFSGVLQGEQPSAASSPVKVSCTCKSYYFYFGYHNWSAGSHYGQKPKPYIRKPGSTRPPVNPNGIPGLCKHLIQFLRALGDNGIITN